MIESDAQNNANTAATAMDGELANNEQVEIVTAGQLIREAREQAGVRLPSLAASLKVPAAKLEALENNDWSVFPDVVFTRALSSAICRVLKIDPAPVLELLPKAPGQGLSKVNEGINAKVSGGAVPKKSGDFASSKPFPWMGVVVALVVASAGVLFYPQLAARWKQHEADKPAARSSNVAGAMDSAEPVALGGSSNALPDANGAAAGAEPGAAAAPVVPAVMAPALESATPVATVDVPVLKLKAKQDSWVQVKDAAGNVVFEKTIKAGSEQDVIATPPLKVVVGNAGGLELLLRGEPFDLKKVTKGSTARFEVN